MRVLKHNPYVKIKQFFNEGIKQNNVSTIIWSIKFLPINDQDPRHWLEVALFTFLFT